MIRRILNVKAVEVYDVTEEVANTGVNGKGMDCPANSGMVQFFIGCFGCFMLVFYPK
jgi:hypothetical protein